MPPSSREVVVISGQVQGGGAEKGGERSKEGGCESIGVGFPSNVHSTISLQVDSSQEHVCPDPTGTPGVVETESRNWFRGHCHKRQLHAQKKNLF